MPAASCLIRPDQRRKLLRSLARAAVSIRSTSLRRPRCRILRVSGSQGSREQCGSVIARTQEFECSTHFVFREDGYTVRALTICRMPTGRPKCPVAHPPPRFSRHTHGQYRANIEHVRHQTLRESYILQDRSSPFGCSGPPPMAPPRHPPANAAPQTDSCGPAQRTVRAADRPSPHARTPPCARAASRCRCS